MQNDVVLPRLNDEQKAQVLKQWQENQHNNHEIEVDLSGQGDGLSDFSVYKGVWNPAISSARYHASYLYYNNVRLFDGKIAIDMGTGTGLMGVVMALHGAQKVILTDISAAAVTNARENIAKFQLQEKTVVVQGDLFENINERAHIIIFNQPFFGDTPLPNDTIAASMLDSGDLIKRFLKQAPDYLDALGKIVMPFYSKAGPTNNPVIQGPKYGFHVKTMFKTIAQNRRNHDPRVDCLALIYRLCDLVA